MPTELWVQSGTSGELISQSGDELLQRSLKPANMCNMNKYQLDKQNPTLSLGMFLLQRTSWCTKTKLNY